MNWPVYKRELLSYFRTPIAYVFIAAFNLATMISTFFLNSLLDTDQADLQPFFSALPWLLLVLVPGIGMRSWAEEKSSRTLELTLTLPHSIRSVMLAKFLAAWTIVSLALALSFPLVLTLAYLGDPDWGAIVCGYIGGLLMAGSLLAVATLCSVLSRIQVVSFVLSVLSSLLLLIVGWGVFSDFLLRWLPISVVDAIAYLGVITHYEALARGVLPLQDLNYFLLLGSSALILCDLILAGRGRTFLKSLRSIGSRHFVSILSLAGLFILNGFVSYRIDFSEKKAYSISESSLRLAQQLDQSTEVSLFFTRSNPQATPFMKHYSFRVLAVLDQYAEASQGKIRVRRIDPKPDTAEEDEAIRVGLKGLPGPAGNLYFGVGMKSGLKQTVIPFLDPGREDLLEYEIAKALMGLSAPEKPQLGILTQIKMQQIQPDGSTQRWALLDALEASFRVDLWSILPETLPDDLGLLFIVHPKTLGEKEQLTIDRFLQRGGRIMLALDPFSRIELIQKHGRPQLPPGGEMPTFQSQFEPLLKIWGIRFDAGKVVGDVNRAASINLYGQSVPHPLFMKLGPADFGSAPFLKNLKEVFIAEGGSLSLDSSKGLSMEPLLQTTNSSGMLDGFPLSFQDPQAIISSFRSTTERQVVAALFKGKFASATGPGSSKNTEMIVIADVDFLEDRHATRSQNLGGKIIKQPRNDNINLLLNSLEYLAGGGGLASIRTSGVLGRPFGLIRDLQNKAEQRWRAEESILKDKINAAQQQLKQYYARDQAVNSLPLRLEDLKVIKQLRVDERETERRLRGVRLNLREDSARLFHTLIAANILVPLFLLALMAFGFSLLRFKRWPRLRLRALYIAVPTMTAILILSWVFLLEQRTSLKAAPVFERLFDMEALAGVEQVIITENGAQATLLKGPQGVWRIKEAGLQEVNADRLSRLLYDMSEAKIVRRLGSAQGARDAYGLDQGRSLTFDGKFKFKLIIGKQQEHGAFLVRVEGQEHPMIIDNLLHTYTSPEFWIKAQQ